MVREAITEDLDELLSLYLFLHEERIPEKNDYLRDPRLLGFMKRPGITAVTRRLLYSGWEWINKEDEGKN